MQGAPGRFERQYDLERTYHGLLMAESDPARRLLVLAFRHRPIEEREDRVPQVHPHFRSANAVGVAGVEHHLERHLLRLHPRRQQRGVCPVAPPARRARHHLSGGHARCASGRALRPAAGTGGWALAHRLWHGWNPAKNIELQHPLAPIQKLKRAPLLIAFCWRQADHHTARPLVRHSVSPWF